PSQKSSGRRAVCCTGTPAPQTRRRPAEVISSQGAPVLAKSEVPAALPWDQPRLKRDTPPLRNRSPVQTFRSTPSLSPLGNALVSLRVGTDEPALTGVEPPVTEKTLLLLVSSFVQGRETVGMILRPPGQKDRFGLMRCLFLVFGLLGQAVGTDLSESCSSDSGCEAQSPFFSSHDSFMENWASLEEDFEESDGSDDGELDQEDESEEDDDEAYNEVDLLEVAFLMFDVMGVKPPKSGKAPAKTVLKKYLDDPTALQKVWGHWKKLRVNRPARDNANDAWKGAKVLWDEGVLEEMFQAAISGLGWIALASMIAQFGAQVTLMFVTGGAATVIKIALLIPAAIDLWNAFTDVNSNCL
ncbi:unnamed protein product, partial [Symbiodinium necroappetens]